MSLCEAAFLVALIVFIGAAVTTAAMRAAGSPAAAIAKTFVPVVGTLFLTAVLSAGAAALFSPCPKK